MAAGLNSPEMDPKITENANMVQKGFFLQYALIFYVFSRMKTKIWLGVWSSTSFSFFIKKWVKHIFQL